MSELKWSHDEDCWSHLGEECGCPVGALEKRKTAITEFEGYDPVELLRICAKTLEYPERWGDEIKLARANWLRRFASHLEEVRKP